MNSNWVKLEEEVRREKRCREKGHCLPPLLPHRQGSFILSPETSAGGTFLLISPQWDEGTHDW